MFCVADMVQMGADAAAYALVVVATVSPSVTHAAMMFVFLSWGNRGPGRCMEATQDARTVAGRGRL